MRGARALAQLPDDAAAKVVVPYRATPTQKREIDEVLAEETRARKAIAKKAPTQSKVVAYLVELGLEHYWARHVLGGEVDELAAANGWARGKALLEMLRRGLAPDRKTKK